MRSDPHLVDSCLDLAWWCNSSGVRVSECKLLLKLDCGREETVADQEGNEGSRLTMVARAVGSALGAVTSKTADLVRTDSETTSNVPVRKSKKAKSASGLQEKSAAAEKVEARKTQTEVGAKNTRLTKPDRPAENEPVRLSGHRSVCGAGRHTCRASAQHKLECSLRVPLASPPGATA